jgi:quercetin dioxygenase-like cupin family protein
VNQQEFEAGLLREGYQVFLGGMGVNAVIPKHGHDMVERYMAIGGEMIIAQDGNAQIMGPGDSSTVGPNDRHAGHLRASGGKLRKGICTV